MTPAIFSDFRTLDLLIEDRPKCDPSFKFYRSDGPYIDACGFERYSLTCRECGLTFVGIIDPLDDRLLLTSSS